MSRWELFELSHFGEVKGAVGAYGSLIARVQRWAAIVSKVTVRGPRAAHPMLCAVSDEKFESFMHTYMMSVSDQNVSDKNGVGDKNGVEEWSWRMELENVSAKNVSDKSGVGDEKSALNGCKIMDDARKAVARLLNQKYLGFLEWILHEITEFIELACGPNLKGEVSAQKKQWIANLMAESAPLVYQHSLVGKASTLGKMLKYGMAPPSAEEVRKGSVVYARWNLTNDVTYVGETGKWEQRVGQHYMKTRSHEMGSDKPCSGCAEHAKYLKHRPVSAARWFMTPVRVCASKSEAELLEQKIERAINPVLNRMARKFPIEQNYVMLERKQNLKRRAEGKQRAERKWEEIRQRSGKQHDISLFWANDGEKYLSLENLLNHLPPGALGGIEIEYHLGQSTIGSWRRLKNVYGDSSLATEEGDEMTLSEWCTAVGNQQGDGCFNLTKIVKSTPEIEAEFIQKRQLEDGLRKLSNGQLLHLWCDRKKIEPSIRGLWIKKIWDEHEIRYEGLTRKAMDIKIPFVHGLDTRLAKEKIMEVIDRVGADWPPYIKEWHRQHARFTTTARQSIGEIMCNVNKPAFFTETCACRAVEQRLKEKGFNGTLPKVNGHIFLIGREYNGPCKEVLCNHACDIPKPTGWDVKRGWNQVREQLPEVFKANMDPKQWESMLTECRIEEEKPTYSRVNTAAVFTLRKLMNGLVITPLF